MATYDESYTVIEKACAIGVAWNYEEVSDVQVKIAPYIYREDYNTDEEDDTGTLDEVLENEPNGTKGRWLGISAARQAGDETPKLIDYFMPRTYDRVDVAGGYNVGLTLNWHNWYSHGAWSGHDWHEFTKNIPRAAMPSSPEGIEGEDFARIYAPSGKHSAKDFELRWQKPERESNPPSTFKYVIVERKKNREQSFQVLATLDGDATSYIDADTEQGNAYAYRVRYSNGVRKSDPYPSSSSATTMYTYPLKPSITEAKQGTKDNTTCSIRWENGNAAANFEKQSLEYSTDGGDTWSSATIRDSKQTRTATLDIDPDKHYVFKLVIESARKDETGEKVTVESDAYEMYTAPSAPSAVSHTRENDSLNNVTWAYGGSEANLTGFSILRSENGASFVEIGSAVPSAHSFEDGTCKADATYSYKVAAVNGLKGAGYTVSATASEVTRNTPAAPLHVSGYMASSATVHLAIENNSQSATGTDIYMRQENYTDWVKMLAGTARLSEADIDVTGYSGTLYFRAQNVASNADEEDLLSAFSNTVTVTPDSKPEHPVAIEPGNGARVAYAKRLVNGRELKTVRFSWLYASKDGSPQAEAKVYVSWQKTADGAKQPEPMKTVLKVDGSNEYCYWTIEDIQTRELLVDIGSEVRWGVTTKSASGEWDSTDTSGSGMYSSYFTLYNRPEPIVSIPNADTDGNLASFPVVVKVAGVIDLARFDVRIAKSETGEVSDAVTVLEKRGCTGSEVSIPLEEFVPEANTDYFAFVTATDKNGFSNEEEAVAHFATKGEQAAQMIITFANDAEDGTVTVTVFPRQASGATPGRLVLVRDHDGESVPLLDVRSASAVVADKYAPLNVECTYRVMAFSDGGGISVSERKNTLRSPWWFFMWDGGVAKGKWDCQDPWSVKRPDKTRRHYAGRPDPVSYDTSALSVTRKAHFWLETREMAMEFYKLVANGGRCVYKSGDGFVFNADIDGVDITPTYRIDSWYGQVECDITKIAGDPL